MIAYLLYNMDDFFIKTTLNNVIFKFPSSVVLAKTQIQYKCTVTKKTDIKNVFLL